MSSERTNPLITNPTPANPPAVEPTWGQALRVWWSWQWRVIFTMVLLNMFISLGLGGFSEKVGLTRGEFGTVSFVLSCVFTGLVSIYILKDVLDKDFGKFRVCIIPSNSPPR